MREVNYAPRLVPPRLVLQIYVDRPEILKERVDSFVSAGGTLLRAITQEASGKIGSLTVHLPPAEERDDREA